MEENERTKILGNKTKTELELIVNRKISSVEYSFYKYGYADGIESVVKNPSKYIKL